MTQEKVIESGLKPNEKWRIMKNVAVVTVAFMVHFTAYSGAANLQSSINSEAGLGTASLAAVYTGILLSNIFLPAIVIKWLGTKWAVCFSFITYLPYIASQLYPRFYTLVPAAFLLGLGGGPLWCAKCTYLSVAAEAHSTISKIPAGTILLRFLGFFFMIYQMNQIWGNFISSLVLSSGNNAAAVTSVNETMIPILCGANFLANDDDGGVLATQPPEKMQMIAGIYLGCMIVSTLIVAIGLDSMNRYESFRKNKSSGLSGLALLAVTAKQLADPNQLLLLIINIFIGQHQAFFSADFTASFVSCAVGTGSVGYVMMTFGLSDAIGCLVTGYLAKLVGRLPLLIGALFVHGGVFITMLVWRPHPGDQYIMFIIAMLWGLCDSCWTVQINAYYGVLFRGKEEAAFSNYRLWEAFGYIISYVLSSYVRTRYKIYLLLCSLIVGVIGYLTVEYRQYKSEKREKYEKQMKEDVKY
ncbi:UNC93-like protein [Anticarsia gemmatalis]|uniref:UNC93-like protein n=1 Tax=Anticarsia gemmatalis TaxID=129554 RepID=UPI003F75A200